MVYYSRIKENIKSLTQSREAGKIVIRNVYIIVQKTSCCLQEVFLWETKLQSKHAFNSVRRG